MPGVPSASGRLRRPGLGLAYTNTVIFWAMLFNELSIRFLSDAEPDLSNRSCFRARRRCYRHSGTGATVFLAPAGWIADRISMRRLIVGGRSMTVLLILYGLAQEWWQTFTGHPDHVGRERLVPGHLEGHRRLSDDATRTRVHLLIYTVGPSSALVVSPRCWLGRLRTGVALRAIYFAALRRVQRLGAVLHPAASGRAVR
ncbi:MAG: hypothetical protein R2849_15365 [Thermomicrobiales bacterium]